MIHLKRFSLSNGEYVKNIMQVNFDAENLEFDRHLHEKAPRSAATNVPYQLYAVTVRNLIHNVFKHFVQNFMLTLNSKKTNDISLFLKSTFDSY